MKLQEPAYSNKITEKVNIMKTPFYPSFV